MKKNQGIVLKRYIPKKQKISLFDKDFGRLDVRVENKKTLEPLLQNGAYLQYHLEFGMVEAIKEVELIDIPFGLARHDIQFFHHLLELCYYFLPLGSCSPTIFELMLVIFVKNKKPTIHQQTIILCKFFVLLGIYTENIPFNEEQFTLFLSEKIDERELESLITKKNERHIESWLLGCLKIHPQNERFKTMWPLKNGNA